MAAMEELEIHSKSYFARWVSVSAGHTISWSIQPHKKSVNFGIFKHPGQSTSLGSHLPPSESQSTDSNENLPATANTGSRNQQSTVIEKLTGIGLKTIKWVGKCEADKISQGTYDVPASEAGNYALVFDNTFSKQISKTVTLVLLTYPTGLQPHGSAPPSIARAQNTGSSDSLPQPKTRRRGNSRSTLSAQTAETSTSTVHTGQLQKRRRKRHQGWARRFFSLDFTSCTLSYYHDPNSSALRGAIPLSLAAVATNEKTREISIDSGTEIWHLRASNDHDFSSWKSALEKASSADTPKENRNGLSLGGGAGAGGPPELRISLPEQPSPAEEQEWTRVESLVGKVSGSRDAVRRLARDTDPKYLATPVAPAAERGRARSPSPQPASNEAPSGDPKRPFWKRKTSGNSNASGKRPPGPEQTNSSSSQLVVPTGKPASIASHADGMDETHDHLMAILRDLDNVVTEFSTLLSESRQRRHPPRSTVSMAPRRSMESEDLEFFDATDGGANSPLLTIQDSDDEGENGERPDTATEQVDDAPSDSDDDGESTAPQDSSNAAPFFPSRPKTLSPLPLDVIRRRQNILAPTVLPPSLIGFLRKNVGKDLSQISMPVSANEPLSLLQRAAEICEYSPMLDKAAQITDSTERLMYITAFAISSLSSNRVRERSIRKPFNPMLGETYELVREDMGFRFIAEKVSHRPVQLAYQADSREWSLSQSPMPSQKFWGKSAEITTEGRVRISLHATGERFSWIVATSFLRNIIAGEKYVEPVGELTVCNETTGQRTISTFKAGGMFSGRSEEVSTRAVDSHNKPLSLGLIGSWPTSLSLTRDGSQSGKPIWTAGSLVPSAAKHYGLTAFAAALNEITSIEEGHLPATDSRLRPDQRALEEGDLDKAEEVKVQLEEGQRARRREMENAGENWIPRWFSRVSDDGDGEVVWRLKGGKDGYWDERSKGNWSGVVPVFETS